MNQQEFWVIFISSIIGIAVISLFFFVAVIPKIRRFILWRRGIRINADVNSIENTIMTKGSGLFAIPIKRLKLSYAYNGVTFHVKKLQAYAYHEVLPKAGGKISIIIDPKKPTRFTIDQD